MKNAKKLFTRGLSKIFIFLRNEILILKKYIYRTHSKSVHLPGVSELYTINVVIKIIVCTRISFKRQGQHDLIQYIYAFCILKQTKCINLQCTCTLIEVFLFTQFSNKHYVSYNSKKCSDRNTRACINQNLHVSLFRPITHSLYQNIMWVFVCVNGISGRLMNKMKYTN